MSVCRGWRQAAGAAAAPPVRRGSRQDVAPCRSTAGIAGSCSRRPAGAPRTLWPRLTQHSRVGSVQAASGGQTRHDALPVRCRDQHGALQVPAGREQHLPWRGPSWRARWMSWAHSEHRLAPWRGGGPHLRGGPLQRPCSA